MRVQYNILVYFPNSVLRFGRYERLCGVNLAEISVLLSEFEFWDISVDSQQDFFPRSFNCQ